VPSPVNGAVPNRLLNTPKGWTIFFISILALLIMMAQTAA